MSDSKYRPLEAHLSRYPASTWRARFSEIEKVLGFPLPDSARRHRAWWSNNGSNNVMTKAWKSAGWETEQVDMENQALVFRRVGDRLHASSPPADPGARIARAGIAPSRRYDFSFGRLKGTVSWNADPTAPSGESWDAERGSPK